jgi:diguanylate cyclase (GGDEF)-like protein/PAS domain S-box-containing protein
MSNPISTGDLQRVQSLRALGLLDSQPDARYDRLTRIAAATFRMPIAVISLVDAERQWFKSSLGLSLQETPRSVAFCNHTIAQAEAMVVTDALADERFAQTALVTGAPHVRFYAGARVCSADGQPIGTLCVMDRMPRLFGPEELNLLRDLASLVEDELQRGQLVRARESAEAALQHMNGELEQLVDERTRELVEKNEMLRREVRQRHSAETSLLQARQALEQKQELLDAVLETVDVGVVACDAYGFLTVFNRAARELHAIDDVLQTPDDWAHTYQVYAADGATLLEEHELPLRRALKGEQVRDVALTIRPDGAPGRTVLVSGRRLRNQAGEPLGAVAALKDVTELAASRARAAESEERLRTIADNLPALIAYLDTDMRYRFANQRYRDWLGVKAADMIGRTVEEALGPDFYAARAESLRNCLNGHAAHVEVEEDRGRHKRIISSTYLPHIRDGQVVGMYVLSTDSTAARKHERYLIELAHTDPLTGLPNRRSYEQNLAVAASRAKRLKLPMAVAYLDIDNFKQINDTYGHDGGDCVLQEISQRLRAAVRSTDIVSRLAGDEFTVILENVTSADECHLVGQKILEAVRQPMIVRAERVPVTVSVGFAWSLDADVHYLTRKADNALYKAKAGGRDAFVVDVL